MQAAVPMNFSLGLAIKERIICGRDWLFKGGST